MALSNIRKEPRRELTEQLVGVIVLAALIIPDYWLASWVRDYDTHADKPPVIVYMFMSVVVLAAVGFILWGAMVVIHIFGEELCNSLARRGIELRPKQRY
jgi:integral membrane sensor domain MASE1